MNDRIYFDYNASAPLIADAMVLMSKIMQTPYNASSVHSFGREGRRYVEDARVQVAKLINAPSEQVIFNSGATEGNATILHHFATHYPQERIITSTIEHPSIIEGGYPLTRIPVTQEGLVDLAALENALKNGTKASLVSIMLVNNETGIIQPIKDIAALTHKYGALLHSDATQAAGRMPLDMQSLNIDFLTLSSHKIGGPQGIGALALRLCSETPTLLHGGGQEKSARAGTENTAGIAGFGIAAQYAQKNLDNYQTLKTYRDDLESQVKTISPECIFYGQNINRVVNTSLFSLPGVSSETLMMALDLENIAISNGSACSSGRVKPSQTLSAMGMSSNEASSAIRVSMGWNTQEHEIASFLKAWEKIYTRLKNKSITTCRK